MLIDHFPYRTRTYPVHGDDNEATAAVTFHHNGNKLSGRTEHTQKEDFSHDLALNRWNGDVINTFDRERPSNHHHRQPNFLC